MENFDPGDAFGISLLLVAYMIFEICAIVIIMISHLISRSLINKVSNLLKPGHTEKLSETIKFLAYITGFVTIAFVMLEVAQVIALKNNFMWARGNMMFSLQIIDVFMLGLTFCYFGTAAQTTVSIPVLILRSLIFTSTAFVLSVATFMNNDYPMMPGYQSFLISVSGKILLLALTFFYIRKNLRPIKSNPQLKD